MEFTLLPHEEDTLEFYKKLIHETDDIELKKQILKHHFDYLINLHAVEKDFRSIIINSKQALDNNNLERSKLRTKSYRIET